MDLEDDTGRVRPRLAENAEALHCVPEGLPLEARQGLDMSERAARLRYYNLRSWVGVAAKGICEEDKERIREEISAHYDDAFNDALRRGLTKVEAHFASMESLGDCQKAAKVFRKSYLTEREMDWVERAKRPDWALLVAISCVAVYCGLLSVLFLPDDRSAIWSLVTLSVSMAIFAWVVLRVAPSAARSDRFRTYRVLRCFAGLPFALWWPLIMYITCSRLGHSELFFGAAANAIVYFALVFSAGGARIRRLRGFPSTRRPGGHPE